MTEAVEKQMTKQAAIEKRLTPGGKEMGIAKVKNSSLYRIQFNDGGELPDSLKGKSYTRIDYADRDIVAYLVEAWEKAQEPKATTKAKATPTKE